MSLKQWPEDKCEQIMVYMRFLSDRAMGTVPSGATFIREYIMNHPEYLRDSKMSESMGFDLLKMMSTLNDEGSEARRHLLGQYA